jgi:lipoate-protein ligase A
MAEEMKLVDLGRWGTAARLGVALIPSLEVLCPQGKIPSTLLFTQVACPCTYWGYHVDPERWIDIEYCKKKNIELSRFVAIGFGTAYNDETSMAILQILAEDFCRRRGINSMEDGYRETISAVADGIRERFGIDARYRPLNDLYVFRPEFPGGRKMSGNSGICRGGFRQYTFFQTEKTDIATLEKTLKPPPEKFADKGAEVTVAEKATSLEEEIGRKPSYEEVMDAIKIGYAKRFDVEFVPWKWVPWEEPKEFWELARKFQDMFLTDEFIFAKTEERRFGVIPPDVKRSRYALKIPGGPLMDIIALTKEGLIKDISITGSIHCVPPDFTEDIEKLLKGVSINDEDAIKAKIDQVFADREAVIGMGSAEDLKEAIIGTVRKARG